MLGLGTSVTSIDPANIYKELSELEHYGSLTVHYDFSTLIGNHGIEVTGVPNLGGGGEPFDIGGNSGTPLLDKSQFGGRSSVVFSDDEFLIMDREFTSTNKSFTFFVVLQRDDTSDDYIVAGSGEEATNFIEFTGSGENIHFAMQDGSAVTTTLASTTGSTINYTQVTEVPSVLVIRRGTGGILYVYADNGLYIAAMDNGAMREGVSFSFITIGGTDAESADDFVGNIGEVGIYDYDIGDTAAITLSKELSTKWGINRRS